jgi:hypothetical protein
MHGSSLAACSEPVAAARVRWECEALGAEGVCQHTEAAWQGESEHKRRSRRTLDALLAFAGLGVPNADSAVATCAVHLHTAMCGCSLQCTHVAAPGQRSPHCRSGASTCSAAACATAGASAAAAVVWEQCMQRRGAGAERAAVHQHQVPSAGTQCVEWREAVRGKRQGKRQGKRTCEPSRE